jgi:hypothetical protein
MRCEQPIRDIHHLTCYAQLCAFYFAIYDEFAGYMSGEIGGYSEAQSLCGLNGRCIYPDDVALGVDQWTARVARIERRVCLYHIVYHSAIARSECPAQCTNDARGHSMLQPERIAYGNSYLSDLQLI